MTQNIAAAHPSSAAPESTEVEPVAGTVEPVAGTHGAAGAGSDEIFSDPRITAVGLLTETYTGLFAKFSAQFGEHNLALAEFEVLLRLSRSPGNALRMSDLAAQTSLTTSGITRLVDRLERSGLLRRQACPSDRRGLLAALTDAGRQRVAEVLPGHLALIDEWFSGLLEPHEMDAMLSALRKVRDAVRPGATAGSAGER